MTRKFSIGGFVVLWGNLGFCGRLDILKINKNSTDKIMALPKFLC